MERYTMVRKHAGRFPRIHAWLTAASTLALIALFMSYGLRSTGVYYDDDIAHYIIARYSWQHPELFLNLWGRPAFTLLYAPAALLGFETTRLFSALVAGSVCLVSARLANLYNVRWYWLAAVFTGLQPEFLRQAFSSLTELSFTLILCIALLAHKKREWTIAAIAVGWLPLARYESVPIVAVFAVMLFRLKKLRRLPLLAAPLLTQNCYWAIQNQNWTYLLFPVDQLLGLRPGIARFDYGPGEALHYFRLLPAAYGIVVFVLFCYGAWRVRFGILHLCVVITVCALSISYWLLPSAGIAGYARHLSIVAPAVGVLAATGLEKLDELILFRENKIVIGLARVGVIVLLGIVTIGQVSPFQINQEQLTVLQAARWFKNSIYCDRFVLASHIWFQYGAELDAFDTDTFMPITPQNILQAPRGSIIVWDSHYSHRLVWSTPLETLQDDVQFREVQSWEHSTFKMHVYEKIGA